MKDREKIPFPNLERLCDQFVQYDLNELVCFLACSITQNVWEASATHESCGNCHLPNAVRRVAGDMRDITELILQSPR